MVCEVPDKLNDTGLLKSPQEGKWNWQTSCKHFNILILHKVIMPYFTGQIQIPNWTAPKLWKVDMSILEILLDKGLHWALPFKEQYLTLLQINTKIRAMTSIYHLTVSFKEMQSTTNNEWCPNQYVTGRKLINTKILIKQKEV